MNYRGSAGHVAKSSVGGGERIGGLGEPWFPVKITGEIDAATTGLDVVSYTAVEVWGDGGGNTIDKVGGRVLGTTNPGVPLDSATTFAVDDLALARPAYGAGGLIWELVPYEAGGGGGESPGSATCNARKWWGQLRSDSGAVFVVSVASVGSGACGCADDAYTSTAEFDTDSWDAADNFTLCTNAFTVEITKPAGVPTMTLTPVSTGTAMTVAAHCYGDGWAEFSFPGDLADEANCTDTVATGCDADNGFIMRAECQSWAPITASCFQGIEIPSVLQVEFYDATGDAVCLEGVTRQIIYYGAVGDDNWNLNGDSVDIYQDFNVPCSGDHYQISLVCYDGVGSPFCATACPERFQAGIIIYDSGDSPILNATAGLNEADSLTGTGATFELIFTDVALIAGGTGTVSMRFTAP